MKTRSISVADPVRLVPKHYYVDGSGRWFVCHVPSIRHARRLGAAEFGSKHVRLVRPATADDVASYKVWHGDPANQPLPYED